ncbi:hypothetical protein P8C59_006893 [Phyllachora maydis]|uniref:Rhomboid-type serine protease n=1 Tax=Phyllachora maydis TaxID=1825666 RepID=A0AAD9I8J5_9PEZI|nr:hypothetical protein P8C59_006893 [Phyllachora maydis]
MAANNGSHGANPKPASSSPPPGGYYASYSEEEEEESSGLRPSPPNPYASQQHLTATNANNGGAGYYDRPSPNASGVDTSPFDTVFDDHVYPATSTASSSRQQLHQAPSSGAHELNDIPLENQSRAHRDSVKGTGDLPVMHDHVYDAPRPPKPKSKGAVRFGELGMFGANAKRLPWVVYSFTVVQLAVFIAEIVKNANETGSPIMTQPSFNPMIGPSPYVLINMGARFVPCMRNTVGVQDSTQHISWPCPNTTTLDPNSPSQHCTLSDLCGFGGVPDPLYNGDINQSPQPNQWFRFITPIFMHAGLVHIGFNLLLQLTMGKEIEKSIGPIRFFLVYMSSGIFGFVMGGNFAATGISSTGASGALFGIIALTLLDLLYSWKDRRSPVKDLMFILLDVVISFVLGLLPGLDNFSHIGGFLMGLALGICVLHSPNSLRRRIGEDAPYLSVSNGPRSLQTHPGFLQSPVAFFKGRKPLWWAWWLLRLVQVPQLLACEQLVRDRQLAAHQRVKTGPRQQV